MKTKSGELLAALETNAPRCLALGLLAVLLLALTGCVAFVPKPTAYENFGKPVRGEEVAFVQTGRTTRAEIIARLGTNYVSLTQERAIAYPWEGEGLTFDWYFVGVGLFGGSAERYDHESMPGKGGWHAWFAAFDEAGVVRATTFKHLHSHKPLHEQLEAWLNQLPANP
jgi:hypothetical protein